jgi:hypothetical protein
LDVEPFSKTLLTKRGFAPIGMLENWNDGMMGKKKFIHFKNDFYRFYHALFQYSMLHRKKRKQKKTIISIRIPKTIQTFNHPKAPY